MQKIILDTNVLVSALIQKSFPYLILQHIYLERKVELCISEPLLAEYTGVLNRDKFARFPDFVNMANVVLSDIHQHATMYKPDVQVSLIKDAADNRLLELTAVSNADYLITGNTNDFTMPSFKNTQIISPKEYWELSR